MNILCLNCGSATLKLKLYFAREEALSAAADHTFQVDDDYSALIHKALNDLPHPVDLAVHRVVHGGDTFRSPVLISQEVTEMLERLSDLAPLHNPPALKGMAALSSLGIPQVAVFDTAFHATLPEKSHRYALPREILQSSRQTKPQTSQIRRYGFHGISHQWVTERYAELTGSKKPNLISLHLGNGCSATAIKDGKSVDTSMGLTPVEGLVMGSRPGDLDPMIPLILQQKGHTPEEVERLINQESGLLGMAGEKDMEILLQRNDEEAILAVDLFCYRIQKYVGAYFAALEGSAEAIIFTGGIGENAAQIRERICARLGWLGLKLDPGLAMKREGRISTVDSRLHAYVIPTDEERLMAREALKLVSSQGRDGVVPG